MKQHAPRSPDASTPEAHANAPSASSPTVPSRPWPPPSTGPAQPSPPSPAVPSRPWPPPSTVPSQPSPPSSDAPTLLQQTRIREALGEAPTILYIPSAEPGAPAPPRSPGPVGAAPSVDRSGVFDDVTLRMPPRPAAPGAEPEDRTIKVPERQARSADDDAPTVKAEPRASSADPGVPSAPDEESPPEDLRSTVRAFLKRHHRKLWWLHTAYALGLGAFVVAFAQKGFQNARFLAVSVSVAWLLVLLFFRLFGTGARQDFATAWRGARLRFLVMTYVLKNLYQGMLFFLLPFYWKSASLDAPNRWFVLLLGACAVLSTLDLVFDRVLMRWKTLASVFYGVTLFACLNLVIPALLPNTRTLYTLLSAAFVSVLGFCTLHLPFSALWSRMGAVFLVLASAAGVGLAYWTRELIPPVPMHLSSAAVGPSVLPDGRLAMSVTSLHASVIQELRAVTDVVVPGGDGDRLLHVWRHEGREVYRAPEETLRVPGPEGTVRLKSQLAGGRLPRRLTGRWTVDVETEDGQLVGRTSFEVTE